MRPHTFVESTKARQTGRQNFLVLNDSKRIEWWEDVRVGLPLPFEGRGVEGWELARRVSYIVSPTTFTPLTPAFSPPRGEGVASVHVIQR